MEQKKAKDGHLRAVSGMLKAKEQREAPASRGAWRSWAVPPEKEEAVKLP